MNAIIYPGKVTGTIQIPASKSITQRIYVLSLLHKGITTITGYGHSEDEESALNLIKHLGSIIVQKENALKITGMNGTDFSGSINCGESGLLLRMFSIIASLSSEEVVLTGKATLLNRNMSHIEKILCPLNVLVNTTNGKIPVTIKGPLIPHDITVDASESSQYITGLLTAFAHTAKKPLCITLMDAVSIPYIDLTIQTLCEFGYNVKRTDSQIKILPLQMKPNEIFISVEGDWSNAAFWLVAAALNGKLSLKGLNFNSIQGDRCILDIMGQCGITSGFENGVLTVEKPHILYAFHCDATQTPDLFPPLVTLACYCNGISTIKGVHRLVNKESNRAESLINAFSGLGANIKVDDDSMIIEGAGLNGGTIDSCGDHRIAIAASISAVRSEKEITILNAGVVGKSYPEFFNHLRSVGINLNLAVT